jgi:hypothetical protein
VNGHLPPQSTLGVSGHVRRPGAHPAVSQPCRSDSQEPTHAHSITIEAGDAEYTLTDLVFTYVAATATTDFFYDALLMRGFRTNAVREAPEWQTALRQMLVGTGFEVDVTRLGTVMISKIPEVPPEITVAHAAGRNTHQRPRASHSPTNAGTRPPESIEPNCICGAQVDHRNAAEWQHWCFVDGDVTQLRWAPTCEAVP